MTEVISIPEYQILFSFHGRSNMVISILFLTKYLDLGHYVTWVMVLCVCYRSTRLLTAHSSRNSPFHSVALDQKKGMNIKLKIMLLRAIM